MIVPIRYTLEIHSPAPWDPATVDVVDTIARNTLAAAADLIEDRLAIERQTPLEITVRPDLDDVHDEATSGHPALAVRRAGRDLTVGPGY